ncbi:MAG: MGMT family protein [Elusimicrobiaceae bacterium]|nr:MGMT family protein [Elusimicrobiaceae bacterium]
MKKSRPALCLPPGVTKAQLQKLLPEAVLAAMPDYPPFYQRVWLACALIPKGETRTYGRIAAAAGNPRAARAAGAALKRNPFAPAVPCHRVIRQSGEPGGYSAPGGPAKKIALLAAERAAKISKES